MLLRQIILIILCQSNLSLASDLQVKPAPEVSKALSSVTAIETDFTAKQTYIHVQLNKDPKWPSELEVQDHSTFYQVMFNQTLAGMPGKFWDVDSSAVAKVALFQSEESQAAVRIFPKIGQKIPKDSIKAEVLGSRVIITISHPAAAAVLEQKAPAASDPVVMGPPYISPTQEVRSLPEKSHEIPPLKAPVASPTVEAVAAAKGEADQNTLQPQIKVNKDPSEPNLESSLIKATAFIAVLMALSLGIVTRRKFLKLRSYHQDQSKTPSIVNLSSLALSPKQKLSLIQVGMERFLIAVTPSGITFLTTIGEQIVAEKRQMEKGSESVQVSNAKVAAQLMAPSEEKQAFFEHLRLSAEKEDKTAKSASDLTIQRYERKISQEKTPITKNSGGQEIRSDDNGAESKFKKVQAADRGSQPRGKIKIAIDDEGIKNLSPLAESRKISPNRNASPQGAAADNRTIDDVTKLIRDRISGLKKI